MADKMRKLGLKVALAGLQSYRSGIQSINKDNAATRQSMEDVAQGSQKLDLGMAALTGGMQALAAKGIEVLLGGLKRLGKEIYGMASEAGVVAGLKGAFEGLSASVGLTGAEMLQKFRVATGGMVTMKDAMMSFNKAAQLISTDFATMIPDAMGHLSKVSRSTGASLDYLLDSLVIGIGRLSPMILDNLSIQVSLAEASQRAADMFGVNTKALSKQQKQLGMANIVMEKLAINTAHMPGVTGTTTAQMAALGTTLKDVRTEIGLRFLPVLSEWMGIANALATEFMPKLIPAAEKVSNAVMGMMTWFQKLVPVQKIVAGLSEAFDAFVTGMQTALAPALEVWGNWTGIIKAYIESIVNILTGGGLGKVFEELPGKIEAAFAVIGPIIEEVTKYLTYFFRVARDVFAGVEALLKGDTERATKFFTKAFNTAIATVIALFKRLGAQVIEWGKSLIASYSKGIIEGIKAYLSAALQSVANFIKSFMAPGSPPKFLPDIGTWGAGAMNEYIKGMEHADFGMLSSFTSQFKTELSGLIQAGDLDASAFADTFFELRGTVMKVMDDFKKTGKVAAGALDPLRKNLGKTGEALAELIEKQLAFSALDKQIEELEKGFSEAMDGISKKFEGLTDQEEALNDALMPFIKNLEKLRAQEVVELDELREMLDAGEIGLEEYEDRVKAVKDQTREAEKAYNVKRAEQVKSRQNIQEQKEALQDQAKTLQDERREKLKALAEERKALAEGITALQDRLAFHRETLGVMKQQDQLLKKMAERMPKVGVGAGPKVDGMPALPKVEDLLGEDMPTVLESVDDFRKRMEDLGSLEIEPFDLGELLPDVETTKREVSAWFSASLAGIQTAAQNSPIAQWILDAFFVKLPEVIKGISTWMESNFPMAFYMVPKILEEVFSGDFQGALQLAIDWFEWFKSYIAIWWAMEIEPKLKPFKEWWEKTWPILQAIAVTAWKVISDVVSAAVKVIVDDVWPKLQEAWDNLSEALGLGQITWEDTWYAIKTAVMVVGAVIGAVILGVVAVIVGLANAIASAAQTITSAMRNTKEGWIKIWAAITTSLELAKKFILAIIKGDFALAWETMKQGLVATKIFWEGVWLAIKGAFEASIGLILSIIGGFVEGIIDFFTNLYKDLIGESIITDMLTDIWTAFTKTFTDILEKAGEFVTGVIDFFKGLLTDLVGDDGTVTNMAKKIYDTVVGAFNDIIKTAGEMVESFKQVGIDIFAGIWEGLKEKWQEVKKWILGRFSKLGKDVEDEMEIESPSKVFSRIGEKMAEGVEVGFGLEGLEKKVSMSVAPAIMMSKTARPISTSNTNNNVDRSIDSRNQSVSMPVTVVDSQVSLAQFRETFRQMLTERG